jgi:LTXXQ motif family protein
MNGFRKSVSALAIGAMIVGGVGAAALTPAQAQTGVPGQTTPANPGPHHGKWGMGNHWGKWRGDAMRFTEGRIAYLRAVLKITPAEEPQFQQLAEAMRANTRDRIDAFKAMRGQWKKPMNAVERAELGVRMARTRVQQEERLLAAFKPLYQALSPDQQKLADRLSAMMMHRHMGRHGHGRHW